MAGTATATRWWQSILSRSLFAILGITLLFGSFSSMLVSGSVAEREQERALLELTELIDAIESTASVACFTQDEQLAAEVAQGLLRDSFALRVVIRAGGKVLARAQRAPTQDERILPLPNMKKLGADTMSPSWQVARRLKSPFNPGEVVGDIVLDTDQTAIDVRIWDSAWNTVLLLVGQMLLVVAAVAAMMFYLVVQPIKLISDRLHHIDPTLGTPLAVPEGHEKSEVGRLVEDINDLTGRLVQTLEQERDLQQRQVIAQRKYQNLFDNAASGIFVVDRAGRLKSFNRAFVDLTWMPNEPSAEGRVLTEIPWLEPDKLLFLLEKTLDEANGSAALDADLLIVGHCGDERWLHVACVSLGDGNAQGTVTDITARKREELSARQLAVTDSLTGFANRAGLQGALAELVPSDPPFALVMLDLDGFKQINEAKGFPVGDQLLMMVASRIRQVLADGDKVARIGGDEFALVLNGVCYRAMASERAERLQKLLSESFVLKMGGEKLDISIGASIGIAFFPADGLDVHRLFRSVELALNTAQAEGGRRYCFFDPAQQAAVEHRQRLEDDLRQALEAGEFHLVFQPIVDIVARRLVGAETLLRWSHPERGTVSPEIFIPLAEELGLIGDIGGMVLDVACRQVAEWRRMGLDMYVSVNVSARQIPDLLPLGAIQERLLRHGLSSDALAIEITEGILMSNIAVALQWIQSLRSAGLRVYLDDFGTGYSSLSYLKRFPLDTVKIDKSFIRDMDADNSDRALVYAIVTMAGSLGLKVVAEGVEEARQMEILREMGCGYVQGYYFSRPLKGDDFFHLAMRINDDLAAGRL